MPQRLIPAGAGNTSTERSVTSQRPAHPRGCGEHAWPCRSAESQAGSSPRVRGTLLESGAAVLRERLIPAGAGNTWRRCWRIAPPTAHPRGCGEHIFPAFQRRLCVGSSPRVRGTRSLALGDFAAIRLIPAGAGNTRLSAIAVGVKAAHPRGCGEHNGGTGVTSTSNGSSPRVRGTPSRHHPLGARYRLIPAGAGNTVGTHVDCQTTAAHPRGCGEHLLDISVV